MTRIAAVVALVATALLLTPAYPVGVLWLGYSWCLVLSGAAGRQW